MTPVWLKNLKKFATGTANGSKQCIDVHVANTITTAAGALAYQERRFHDPGTTNIPASSSNPVQLDAVFGTTAGANVSGSRSQMMVNWNGGEAIEILLGATAGTAVAIAAFGAGQTRTVGVTLVNGDKIWVRALKNAAITSGELLVVLEA